MLQKVTSRYKNYRLNALYPTTVEGREKINAARRVAYNKQERKARGRTQGTGEA